MEDLQKPTMEQYGYYVRKSYDDLPSGWMFEGGEEEYYKALKLYEESLNKQNHGKERKSNTTRIDSTNS